MGWRCGVCDDFALYRLFLQYISNDDRMDINIKYPMIVGSDFRFESRIAQDANPDGLLELRN